MKPLGVRINELAREIAVPPNRIVKPAPFLDDQRIVKQPELFEALG